MIRLAWANREIGLEFETNWRSWLTLVDVLGLEKGGGRRSGGSWIGRTVGRPARPTASQLANALLGRRKCVPLVTASVLRYVRQRAWPLRFYLYLPVYGVESVSQDPLMHFAAGFEWGFAFSLKLIEELRSINISLAIVYSDKIIFIHNNFRNLSNGKAARFEKLRA